MVVRNRRGRRRTGVAFASQPHAGLRPRPTCFAAPRTRCGRAVALAAAARAGLHGEVTQGHGPRGSAGPTGRPQVPDRAKRARDSTEGFARTGEHAPGTPPILLHVIARGKIARSPEAELVARYEKRMTWPTKLTELPETGGHPRTGRAAPHRPARREGRAARLRSLCQTAGEVARRGHSRNPLRARRRRRAFPGGTRRGRPALCLRPGDLAAPPRPRHADGAALPRDEHPCRPSLSSGRVGS
ncbi:MAG: 23S rRNA (pseudouridine1915-N3)-methyltransferase RlmH [Erythrobacteraceae bacterium HL-111]|nr:MAG: 23S rRNA (pseudouridine1915-N3)-methyltransferase RlmH [Erythrobacteraceae bacterium HL-111]